MEFLGGAQSTQRGLFGLLALDVTDDGEMIVGQEYRDIRDRDAVYWTREEGWRSVTDLLTQDFDLDLTNWTLERVLSVSGDGTLLAGDGYYTRPSGVREFRAWVAVIPSPPSAALLAAGALALCTRRRP